MCNSANGRLWWFVTATVVLAAAGGLFFLVLKARVKERERWALLDEEEVLNTELTQLDRELVNVVQV